MRKSETAPTTVTASAIIAIVDCGKVETPLVDVDRDGAEEESVVLFALV